MMKKILLGILLLVSFLSFSQNAAEFENGITIQKEQVLASKYVSYGESYITNWRDDVLDNGATYFPNNGGYEIGRLHQLGETPSLHFIPAAVGEGVIYSIGKNRTNDLDVSNSASTYVDEDGIIQTAAIDFARIDYTDGDGAFLVEDGSTNLLRWSEEIDLVWEIAAVDITLNAAISPDGTMNADKAVYDTDLNNSHYYRQSITTSIGPDYTISMFVKKAGKNVGSIRALNSGVGDVSFNLDDVTVNQSYGSITPYPNGWFRVTFTFTSVGTSVIVYLYPGTSGTQTGDGINGLYVWGAQLEQQSIASSYIKTEGTTVTRLADVITGAGDSSTFNSEEGVLYIKMAALANASTNFPSVSISDGTNQNQVVIGYRTTSNQLTWLLKQGGTNKIFQTPTISDITAQTEYVFVYKSGNSSLYVDGEEIETSSVNFTFPNGTLTEFSLGGVGLDDLSAKVQGIKYYKSISDAQKDLPYITNFFPLLLIGFRRKRKTEYKTAA